MSKSIYKVGDKVIALNSTVRKNTQPRVKGRIYIVRSIHICSECGRQYINYGYTTNKTHNNCTSCNTEFLSKGLKWTPSKYFCNFDEIGEVLQGALEKEDYQLAIMLRDINKPKQKV